ncbi:hypothetical protein ACWYVZ_08240 [Pediococcus acidilactici]|jgi:hypothetical protein|uniref:Uncharacterized protein n=1 Tax=Pediococcus acidilactici TaxID=1254 RepID=A0AAN5Y9Q8_PEDAC|nr:MULTISPECIES: hypothetical protein [Pediococcus]APR29460.1 hypothetical protein BTW26_10615 [Pediococcus acidilactici]ARW25409.1 hypothetical protein S100424_02007 [Pediococcus acidilactici]ARW27564.1 hypothetical protein S100313_02163 [Pediococcus acidilactici]ARW29573.1 hypothetical protein S101189_02053 [Pediococcus acidilactici]KAF0333214.1 hypothetical protein GBO38_09015 [Pediococcus acidilactici]
MAIDPILTSNKKNTLDDKKVKFSNGNDFSNPDFNISDTDNTANKESNKDKTHKKKRTQTQRLSETTVLKCRTLQPFMTELERADKASIDDIISTLADYYINQGLPDRQKDVFEGMYDINIKRLK